MFPIVMVLRETPAVAAVAVALAIPAALLSSRLLSNYFFEVPPGDPDLLIAAATTMLVAAGAAGFVPAYRASRFDAMSALRHD